MTQPQPRNQSVDTFRLLAALCVIILHLEYLNAPSSIAVGLRLMSRWAIPFFFIVSGYYLAAKSAKTNQVNVQPTVERLIWIFLLWVLIYAPFVVIQHDLTTLLKIITAPAFIYYGLFSHLWFIPSLLFGYLFVAFCHHFNIKILLPIMSVVSVVVALISGAYNIFDLGFPLDFDLARNWLSIPFLYIGFLFFQKGRPNWQVSVLLIIVGAASQVFEARFLYQQYQFSAYAHQFLIGTIPFALGMAGLALSELKFLQHPTLAKWGNEFSLGIYLIHPAVIMISANLLARVAPTLGSVAIWQIIYPAVALVLSLSVLHLLRRFLPLWFDVLFGKHVSPIQRV